MKAVCSFSAVNLMLLCSLLFIMFAATFLCHVYLVYVNVHFCAANSLPFFNVHIRF